MLRTYNAPARPRASLLIVLGTVTLLAAACGGGGTGPTDALSAAADPVSTTAPVASTAVGAQVATTAAGEARLTLPAPVSSPGAQGQSGAATPEADPDTATAGAPTTAAPITAAPTTAAPITAAPTTAAPTTAAPTTAAPVANNFPAVAVQRIADRTQVNANDQLGGGSRPVLLWFWSPF